VLLFNFSSLLGFCGGVLWWLGGFGGGWVGGLWGGGVVFGGGLVWWGGGVGLRSPSPPATLSRGKSPLLRQARLAPIFSFLCLEFTPPVEYGPTD